METWAREARTVVVDVDLAELRKFPSFGKPLDLPVHADAATFVAALLARLEGFSGPDLSDWRERVSGWLAQYPVCLPDSREEVTVNPYVFMDSLSRYLADDAQIFIDTGCAVAWTMQGLSGAR